MLKEYLKIFVQKCLPKNNDDVLIGTLSRQVHQRYDAKKRALDIWTPNVSASRKASPTRYSLQDIQQKAKIRNTRKENKALE